MTMPIRNIRLPPSLPAGWFLAKVTAVAEDPDSTDHPEDSDGVPIASGGGIALPFTPVPEPTQVQNRVPGGPASSASSALWRAADPQGTLLTVRRHRHLASKAGKGPPMRVTTG